MVEARNILNAQGANVESGIRAEDLASTRFFTGIGSQVEVLSAQTALTDARDFYASALRNYSVAYSQLLRATGEDMVQSASPNRRHNR
jgi:outer membrane protein TolC